MYFRIVEMVDVVLFISSEEYLILQSVVCVNLLRNLALDTSTTET